MKGPWVTSWRIPIFQELGRESGTIKYAQEEANKTRVFDVVKLMDRQDSSNGESGQKLMYYEVKYFYGTFMSPQGKNSGISHKFRNLDILFISPECRTVQHFVITELQDMPENGFVQ